MLNANGAPAGEKSFVFYNPPVVNRALGIRRSYINESRARRAGISESRSADDGVCQLAAAHRDPADVSAKANPTAAGPSRKRFAAIAAAICRTSGARSSAGCATDEIRGVVSTNALELGIDIGSLDAVVMAGYPGTIASTWQRAGRAGRRSGSSCAVMVASCAPLDQYIVRASRLFFREYAGARVYPAGQSGNSGESPEVRGVRTADRAGGEIRRRRCRRICARVWRKRDFCIARGNIVTGRRKRIRRTR